MPAKLFPIGARYMMLSAFGFSVMAVFVKLAGEQGLPVIEIVAARSLISLVLSYLVVRRLRIPALGNNRRLLLLRGVVGFFALTCVYYALTHLPLAEATVLQYLHPMFTALLAIIFLRERPAAATIVCIVISFAGLLLISRPAALFGLMASSYDTQAILAAIAGAFGSGCAYVIVRKLSATENASVIVLYFPMVSLPATIPFVWQYGVMPEGITWFYLLGMGLFTQLGQIALTKGMQTETAARASSFSYLQVVFATVLGIVFFAEIPDAFTIGGALFIVAGAVVNVMWQGGSKGRQ